MNPDESSLPVETLSNVVGNPYDPNCPSRQVLDLIGDKWTVLIVGSLYAGSLRFSEIQKRVGGISQKMLTQTLRALEADGLVVRKVFAEVPPRVEYTLTETGMSLREPLGAITEWARKNLSSVLQARESYAQTH